MQLSSALKNLALGAMTALLLAACTTPVELDKNTAGAPVESRTPGSPSGSQSGVAAVDASKAGGAGQAGAGGAWPLPTFPVSSTSTSTATS